MFSICKFNVASVQFAKFLDVLMLELTICDDERLSVDSNTDMRKGNVLIKMWRKPFEVRF